MEKTFDPKKQAALIVNLALNSFSTSEDVQKLHHDFYSQASMADILRPLAKCYLKIVTNSKDKIDVKGRFQALKEFMARPAKNQEEVKLKKFLFSVEKEFTSDAPNAFNYFNTLLERKSSAGESGSQVEFTASLKKPLWPVDKLFLKITTFVKRFGINYQKCIEDLGERIRQQPTTAAELEHFFLCVIITSNQEDLSNYMASYIKVMESLLQNNYEDNYILALAKIIGTKDSNRYIQRLVETLSQKNDLAEIKKNIEEKFSALETSLRTIDGLAEALKDLRDYHHNQIMPLVEEQHMKLKSLCELAIYIETSKYCQNECLNFIVRDLSQKIILMVKNERGHDLSSITGLVDISKAGDSVNKLMLDIISHNEDELIDYVSSPYRSSASGMYNHQQEIPDMNVIREIEAWCKKRATEEEDYKRLLSSITGMQHGKGKPNLDNLSKLFDWCVQPLGKDSPTLELDKALKLFSSVTNMQHGKGEPNLDNLSKLFNWCLQPLGKDGPTLELDKTLKLFSSVANMQHGKGEPNLDNLSKLFNWCLQPLGKDGPTLELGKAIRLFSSVTCMQMGKGEPNLDNVKKLFDWCLQPLGVGTQELELDKALGLFSSTTAMQNGRGEPNLDSLSKLFDWCIEKTSKDITKPNIDVALSLYSSVTNMQNSKGEPNLDNLTKLFNWCVRPWGENGPKLNLDTALELFRSITDMQMCKGEPKIEVLSKIFFRYGITLVGYEPQLKKGIAPRIFSSVTGMQSGQGAQETYRHLDKISKLIEFFLSKYPNNYLSQLSKYTSAQQGILRTIQDVIKNEPEAKEWFESNDENIESDE